MIRDRRSVTATDAEHGRHCIELHLGLHKDPWSSAYYNPFSALLLVGLMRLVAQSHPAFRIFTRGTVASSGYTIGV